MTGVRAPVVAGSFYPAAPGVLAGTVDGLLAGARSESHPALDRARLRGLIVPHAGYAYSGPVAATAYALLPLPGRAPSVVVILGPSHFEPLRGLAVSTREAWRTPLGEVPIDDQVRRTLVARGTASDEAPHRDEHSIEVQLPFLQRCLPGVPLLPMAVGSGSPWAAAELLVEVLPEDALLVVSTDLSHYHGAARARELDARTAAAVERADVEALRPDDACGVDALRVAVAWAQLGGHLIRVLELGNSADTAGDPRRVVGYGAFAILAAPSPGPNEPHASA